jgi:hypothetical protein
MEHLNTACFKLLFKRFLRFRHFEISLRLRVIICELIEEMDKGLTS